MFNVANISRDGQQAPEGTPTGRPIRTGWDAVEDHMRRHDEAMVKDLANDIDTMLVFAGLFSAALTAFLAQVYQNLQPDNSKTTVDLLSNISTQLGSFTISQPFVNATASNSTASDCTSSPFHAHPADITINTLWFLSLVFSLASALFGLLAKRWLREYMQWDYVLAPPRENILIRQIRFEAWETWNVSTTISFIPLLLEIAVVLFYSGMIVFLWTLERTVAIIVTAVISVFLVATIFLTFLPLFSRHCPYKSPTCLVCIYIWQYLRDLIHSFRHPRDPEDRETKRNIYQWRQRDVQLIRWSSVAAITKVLPFLDHLDKANPIVDELYEAATLIRAFLWVLCGSESEHDSERLPQRVSQCLRSLHALRRGPGSQPFISEARIHFVSTTLLLERNDISMQDAFIRCHSPELHIDVLGSYALTVGRLFQHRSAHIKCSNHAFCHVLQMRHAKVPNFETDSKLQWILRRVALQALKSQSEVWVSQLTRIDSASTQERETIMEQTYIVVRLIGMLSLYQEEAYLGDSDLPDTLFVSEIGSLLADIYRRLSSFTIAHWTGVPVILLELLCRSKKVSFDKDGVLSVQDTSFKAPPDLPFSGVFMESVLVASYFHSRGNSQVDRHTFIHLAEFSLQIIPYPDLSSPLRLTVEETVRRLLGMMQTVAERSRAVSNRNCGGFIDLPWVSRIAAALERDQGRMVDERIFMHALNKLQLVQLLSTLEKCSDAGLLTGDDVEGSLSSCFEYLELHTDDIGRLLPGWQWRVDSEERVYYVNRDTRETSTDRPGGAGSDSDGAGPAERPTIDTGARIEEIQDEGTPSATDEAMGPSDMNTIPSSPREASLDIGSGQHELVLASHPSEHTRGGLRNALDTAIGAYDTDIAEPVDMDEGIPHLPGVANDIQNLVQPRDSELTNHPASHIEQHGTVSVSVDDSRIVPSDLRPPPLVGQSEPIVTSAHQDVMGRFDTNHNSSIDDNDGGGHTTSGTADTQANRDLSLSNTENRVMSNVSTHPEHADGPAKGVGQN